MAMIANANPILRGLAVVIAGIALIAVVRTCSAPTSRSDTVANERAALREGAADYSAADSDTTAESLRTLISEVRALRDEQARLAEANHALRSTNRGLNAQQQRTGEVLTERLAATQTDLQHQERRITQQASDLDTRVAKLQRQLTTWIRARTADQPRGAGPAGDIPPGLGYELVAPSTDEVVWIPPLDADASASIAAPTSFERLWASSGSTARAVAPVDPAYTLPRNATLIGARSLTALVGRVPVAGQVVDAFPFKVVIGRDNLAANGLVLPDVAGMVFSGRAVGDWTLACVRGEVFSATYLFADGRVQSYPQDPDVEATEPLGWISDPFGVPCLVGERKTNAVGYLSQRMGLAAAAATAEAAAAAETTTSVSPIGGAVTGAVTGDVSAYIRQRSLSAGLAEASRWLDERQSQAFDAVYVAPDQPLAVHLDRELAIDYDPAGRRLDHQRVGTEVTDGPLD